MAESTFILVLIIIVVHTFLKIIVAFLNSMKFNPWTWIYQLSRYCMNRNLNILAYQFFVDSVFLRSLEFDATGVLIIEWFMVLLSFFTPKHSNSITPFTNRGRLNCPKMKRPTNTGFLEWTVYISILQNHNIHESVRNYTGSDGIVKSQDPNASDNDFEN